MGPDAGLWEIEGEAKSRRWEGIICFCFFFFGLVWCTLTLFFLLSSGTLFGWSKLFRGFLLEKLSSRKS